jgi:hypothetical protein
VFAVPDSDQIPQGSENDAMYQQRKSPLSFEVQPEYNNSVIALSRPVSGVASGSIDPCKHVWPLQVRLARDHRVERLKFDRQHSRSQIGLNTGLTRRNHQRAYNLAQCPDEADNGLLLLARDLRKHRQRQYRALVAVRIGKLFGSSLESAVSFEERQRGGIVDRGLHAVGVQMRCQRIPPRVLDRVEMIDVGAVRANRGHDHILDLIETGIINRRRLLARPGPCRQIR